MHPRRGKIPQLLPGFVQDVGDPYLHIKLPVTVEESEEIIELEKNEVVAEIIEYQLERKQNEG